MRNTKETLNKKRELRRMWKNTIDVNSFPHQIKKVCKDCGELKMCDWLSSFTQTGKPEYKARCEDCHNAYIRARRKLGYVKEARNKNRKQLLIIRKQKAVDFLGGECKICGYKKSLSALTFHHINPKEKEFEIGFIKDHSWDKVLKELKKCDLLCFNCHMELHEKLNKE
jgi:5-methylcytosine-specific restriction endonuclease McrA